MKIYQYTLIVILHITFTAGLHASEIEKLVIIGSGAAGSSAAIFSGQADLHPLVVHDTDCNAQMALIHKIDNYPGILEEIEGVDLLHNFRKQAESYGARFIEDSVVEVDFLNRPFKITFASERIVYSDAVIIASGTNKRWLQLSSEQLLRGKGVVSATFCRNTDYHGKNVVVVGGGHAALQEAMHIADQAKHITIVNRGSKFQASAFHQNAVFARPNIDVIYNTEVNDILDVSKGKVTGVVLSERETGENHEREADIILIAIGNKPNSELYKDQLELTPAGNIVINGKNTSTNIPGVFAAGDVTDVVYGRVVIAAGAGAMAALDAVRYLDTLK